MEYASRESYESSGWPGVRYTIRKMTFGRRMELLQAIREAGHALEFLDAGKECADKLKAALAVAEIDRLYLKWGLESIEGLELDGEPATAESLMERGPEGLFREIVNRIKGESLLTEAERKN
jgi:hypothetical protein